MKYAFFQGCNIPVRIEQYADSTEAVLQVFGIELEKIPEFNCCGYPVRNVDEKAYILPSVRNMAIAEKAGLDILVICNCCFASLQKARNVLEKDSSLKEEINTLLAKEGLAYTGKTVIRHYLTVLHEIGSETIKKKLVNTCKDLKLSVIHGCHVLRPREITRFDDSFVPTNNRRPRRCDRGNKPRLARQDGVLWRSPGWAERPTLPQPARREDHRGAEGRGRLHHPYMFLLPPPV